MSMAADNHRSFFNILGILSVDDVYYVETPKRSEALLPSTADRSSESASHHQSDNRLPPELLHRFGVWGIQGKLELLHELCHLQAVGQSVVYVDRYWHGAAAVCLSNFAEGDAGRGVFVGE